MPTERELYALKVLEKLQIRKDWGLRFDQNDLKAACDLLKKKQVILDRFTGFCAGIQDRNLNPAEYAKCLIRYLERCGWINWDEVEIDPNYTFTQHAEEDSIKSFVIPLSHKDPSWRPKGVGFGFD